VQLFRARNEMLSENVYQDLFLRAEYLLDEQLISGQKKCQNFSTA
jgi:hypothetical protein